MDNLKEKMLKHDWFHDKSDCFSTFTRGCLEKDALIRELKKRPLNEVAELFKLVPTELKDAWFMELTEEMAASMQPESHP